MMAALEIATIVLAILKLCGAASVSWWVVIAPAMFAAVVFMLLKSIGP